jgi:aminoglycoside phosphotransferase (APT) family kinase protein
LAKEAGRLNPSIHPAAERYSFVILTPRFRNSSHLIFLLLPEGETEPALVAKVPRHRGQCSSTLGEAEQLRLIQARRPTGFDSVPRLVACAAMDGRTILLETAMRGRAMDRATVRRNASRCCEAVLEWLIDVQTATRMGPEPGGNDLGRLIERDLLDVQAAIPAEAGLLEKTRALVAPLSRASVPRVLEHGDLSHPNLLLGPEGRLGVIDWELADLHGLPATDLYFFLTYVGMALKGGPTIPNALSAVDQAFFGQRSWARSYVRRYTESLGLPRDTLTPLFIACWARQVAGLVRRVGNGGDGSEWLRGNWRFAAWRHAVDEAGRLDWEDLP